MEFFNNFLSYFRRIRKPIEKADDAKPILKETWTYLFISVGMLCLTCLIGRLLNFIPILSKLLLIVTSVFMILSAVFAFMIFAIHKVMKRLKNLTCDKCGSKLGDLETTTYQEISRRISKQNDTDILYVTVKFTCTCSNCGTVKNFTETLCSGTIKNNKYDTTIKLLPTETLVLDYLQGNIRV